VTGAGKGLGRATAEALLAEGALVYANDIVDGSLDDCSGGARLIPLYFDVSDGEAAKSAFRRIIAEAGQLDVLVNNAGIMRDALIGSVTRDLMEEVFRVNVFGAMEMLQLAAKVMMRRGSGSIVNLTSVVGITGNPGQLVYSATKGAIISMTRTAAKELGARGIRVNAVAPGMIDTDMMRSVEKKHLDRYISNTPAKRLGRPEEIADACVYLASDMSTFVNGHILSVDAAVLV
jgi:3-oxoacyl-[acyl-carrier protein] reductase